ncbi:hypothetical protein Fmac_003878 [Flemingia macrophylla]|uniref:Uncharacterized protein n=1 Tax=Flemingia macrophylla TaxID=520843 RepID=A0ABD1N3I7_9FABA
MIRCCMLAIQKHRIIILGNDSLIVQKTTKTKDSTLWILFFHPIHHEKKVFTETQVDASSKINLIPSWIINLPSPHSIHTNRGKSNKMAS